MATGLEFYFNSDTTPGDYTGAWQTVLTCTVNRVGRAGAKNFFIIAHLSGSVTGLNSSGQVRLQVDAVSYGSTVGPVLYSDTDPHGYTFDFVKRLSLDASSHAITLQVNEVGTDAYTVENCSIIVLEESANAEYAEYEVEEDTGANVGWVDYLTLPQFAPSSTTNYIIIASCVMNCEDESDAGVEGVRLVETEQAALTISEGTGFLVGPQNDRHERTVGWAAYAELTSATTYTFKIQMNGDGAADYVECRRAAIVAIPVGDFENVYLDKNSQKVFHQGLNYSDSEAVLAAQACNAADHLIFAGVSCSNEDPNQNGYWRLNFDGTTYFPAYMLDDRDEDLERFYQSFVVYGVNLAADNYDIEIEGNSDSNHVDAEGCTDIDTFLIVCEIPPAPPAVARRVYVTHV